MKRFALAICLAACLALALVPSAFAVNRVEVQDGGVGVNGNLSVGVMFENDVALKAVVIPLIIKEVTPGSYITALTLVNPVPGSRMVGFLGDIVASNTYPTGGTAAVAGCNSAWYTDGGGFVAAGAGPIDGSPDGVLMARQKIASPDFPIGTDFPSSPSFRLNLTVNGTIGFFEIDTTCVTPANHLSYVNTLNASIAPSFEKGTIEILANQCPAGSIANAVVNATAGVQASNQASGVDAESDPIQFFKVSGPGSVNVNTGLWTWTPDCSDVPGPHAVSIEVTDKGQGSCPTVDFTVNVAAPALSLNCGADVSVHWGAVAAKTITASGGCPSLIWEVQNGPGAVDGSGNWSYATGCGDLGTVTVEISAEDATGQVASCTFDLTVTNTAPTCSDPADITAPTGVAFSVPLGPASDGDGDALTYTLEPGAPGWVSVNGNLLEGTRPGGDDTPYNVCFTVSDGCQSSGICCIGVLFESPYIVCIKGEDTTGALVNYATSLGGQNKTVCVWVDPATGSSGLEGGFDFLICYDQSALSFISASRGDDLHADWEYFTYRTGMFGGNCGTGCPNGFVRLVGIADMNNGITPDPAAFDLAGCIVNLTFFVTSDQNFEGSCPHIGFCSYDCGDNVISSKDGNTLYLASSGATLGPDYDLNYCLDNSPKGAPEQFIDFCPGAICIVPPPDDRGDINLNGIANEIGDAVLLSNFFIYGSSVWHPTYGPSQIFASDVNNDGIVLTVADLVYLIRIITGDAQPFPDENINPKVAPYASSVDVISNVRNNTLTVSTSSSVELGGALLVYRFSGMTVGEAALTAGSGLKMKSRVSGGELRILVYPDPATAGGKVNAGSNDLVTVTVEGNGSIELVESQFSDAEGALLSVESLKSLVPTSFALHQNFPNPFNAGTVIPVSLSKESDWTLTVYNVAGQVVKTFAGHDEPGVVNIAWDGRSNDNSVVPSGMYFYRLNTKDFIATKKMVLIK
ncbi:MAG: T9SS type A sorting domain-containing protein [Candidatus Zixiibacteriota bacterium]